MTEREPVVVVGAGLVGPVLALALARRGHAVRVFERRPDPRHSPPERGRSVNVVISHRGWAVLRQVGVEERVREICRPLTGRQVHPVGGGAPSRQPYSRSGDAIWCVERPALNAVLLDALEAEGSIEVHHMHRCVEVDLTGRRAGFVHQAEDRLVWEPFERLLATDGAFSGVRSSLLHGRFDYSQEYVPLGYREFQIPSVAAGGPSLDLGAFHVWPRGRALFTAFPNADDSFTGSLFLPHEGPGSFESLDDVEAVRALVRASLPSLEPWWPNLVADLARNPTASMVTIRARPWHHQGCLALVGDAAHAILPFFGQGMNCGFEDVAALVRMLDASGDDWSGALEAYDAERRPNADAIALLSKRHYEALGQSARPEVEQRLEAAVDTLLFSRWPDRFAPLYERVAFSTTPYVEVLRAEREREAIVREVLETPRLRERWDDVGEAVVEQVVRSGGGERIARVAHYISLLEKALADGRIQADERALLDEAAQSLGITEASVHWAESLMAEHQDAAPPTSLLSKMRREVSLENLKAVLLHEIRLR